jgi:hypothetical protein
MLDEATLRLRGERGSARLDDTGGRVHCILGAGDSHDVAFDVELHDVASRDL